MISNGHSYSDSRYVRGLHCPHALVRSLSVLAHWPDAPSAALALTFLTRMRTVIAREHMTLDFSFQDATSDDTVSAEFMVQTSSATSTASLFGPSLGILLVFGLFRAALRRWGRVR